MAKIPSSLIVLLVAICGCIMLEYAQAKENKAPAPENIIPFDSKIDCDQIPDIEERLKKFVHPPVTKEEVCRKKGDKPSPSPVITRNRHYIEEEDDDYEEIPTRPRNNDRMRDQDEDESNQSRVTPLETILAANTAKAWASGVIRQLDREELLEDEWEEQAALYVLPGEDPKRERVVIQA